MLRGCSLDAFQVAMRGPLQKAPSTLRDLLPEAAMAPGLGWALARNIFSAYFIATQITEDIQIPRRSCRFRHNAIYG